MDSNDTTGRYLGAAFLGVIVTSLVSGVAASAAFGPGSVADMLAHVATDAGTMHIAILAGTCNAVGILILATLLYATLKAASRTIALIAALCWVGESMFYALNQIASAGLMRLGAAFVAAGSPAEAAYQALGAFLYRDVFELGGTILMFFYCAGGLLFYALFFRSRLIPRWLSAYGIAAVLLGLAAGSIELLGNHIGTAAYIAIFPFEFATGMLLLVRGVDRRAISAPLTAGIAPAR